MNDGMSFDMYPMASLAPGMTLRLSSAQTCTEWSVAPHPLRNGSAHLAALPATASSLPMT